MEIRVGDKVHYAPTHGKKENGIVKEVSDDKKTVWVVYHCANDWDDYQNYTGQNTPIDRLKNGWIK